MYLSALEQFLLLNDYSNFSFTFFLVSVPISYWYYMLEWSNIPLTSFSELLSSNLDYFEIKYRYIPFLFPFCKNIFFSLVNIQYYKLNLLLFFLVSSLALYKSHVFPKTIWQYLIEKTHIVAQQILKPVFGAHYPFTFRFLNYYPFLYHLFIYILFSNILGLIPYGFSNSAYIIHNFLLSLSFLLGLTFIGIFLQGIYYYKLFIPKNVPVYLIPFLMIIEIISHIAKAFSLAIRLFANIMSSHILLHILAGFTLKILDFNLLIGLIPCLLILVIVFLEIGIAFLQAYVFTVLLTIYFEETFKLLELQPGLHKSEKHPFILESDFSSHNNIIQIN